VSSTLDDVELSIAPNGLAASLLRPDGTSFGSAGHTVSGVTRVMSVADVVAQTRGEWDWARAKTLQELTR
jgi:hypothetical protein